jgi:RNA polymerase sigma factor (sigma-70 family)
MVRIVPEAVRVSVPQDQLIRLLMAERGKVLAYIRSIVRREDMAEDVFQDVSILALNKRSEIRDEHHFLRWIRAAAKLTALNAVRKARVRELTLDDQVLDVLDQSWARADDDSEAAVAAALEECMKGLSPAAQNIIRERFEAGRSVIEVAKVTGRQVDSLYVAISRIYRSLSDCISRRIASSEARLG